MRSNSADPRYRPESGWRIDQIPSKRVRKIECEDGAVRYLLPLMILRDGEHKFDSGLWLSPSEAEVLHAALSLVLADHEENRQRPVYGSPF
ncbi:hypothetical protein ACFV0R_25915 [Streptomyces sp. NPDC059578]|uniref:hypothetical protein n=1 Tax=Streptomyces sp. NPDC059578 TaxID=3346874 RepID=UPI0036BA8273